MYYLCVRPHFPPAVETHLWFVLSAYCEVGFASRSLGGKYERINMIRCGDVLTSRADHIVTFTREGNVGYGCQGTGTDVDA